MLETETRLIKLGVDPTVASKLVAAGYDTPAKIKTAKDKDLKAKGLSTEQIGVLRLRFVVPGG